MLKPQRDQTILVVDDSEESLGFIEYSLSDKYKVETVDSGEKAIEFLKKSTPAVVLLDLMMPGINGYEVCKHIRLVNRFLQTKVILVSATSDLKSKLAGYRHGANDFITKPFVIQELKAKVKVYLDLYNAEKDLNDLNQNLQKEIEERSHKLLEIELDKIQSLRPSEIVHNLKGPLTVISGMVELLVAKYPEISQLKSIKKSSQKMSSIINSILEIEEGFSSEEEFFDIHEVIRDELEFLSFLSSERELGTIHIDINFQSEVLKFKGKKHHFSQIFSNLVKNSVESFQDKRNKSLRIKTYLSEESIHLEFADTGCGMPEGNFEKIFQSRFSTKDEETNLTQRGSGLGLGYCKKVMEMYGGTIDVQSTQGEGTTFLLILPKKD